MAIPEHLKNGTNEMIISFFSNIVRRTFASLTLLNLEFCDVEEKHGKFSTLCELRSSAELEISRLTNSGELRSRHFTHNRAANAYGL